MSLHKENSVDCVSSQRKTGSQLKERTPLAAQTNKAPYSQAVVSGHKKVVRSSDGEPTKPVDSTTRVSPSSRTGCKRLIGELDKCANICPPPEKKMCIDSNVLPVSDHSPINNYIEEVHIEKADGLEDSRVHSISQSSHMEPPPHPLSFEKDNGNRQTEHTEKENICGSDRLSRHTHSSPNTVQLKAQKKIHEFFKSSSPTSDQTTVTGSKTEEKGRIKRSAISKQKVSPSKHLHVQRVFENSSELRLGPPVTSPSARQRQCSKREPEPNGSPRICSPSLRKRSFEEPDKCSSSADPSIHVLPPKKKQCSESNMCVSRHSTVPHTCTWIEQQAHVPPTEKLDNMLGECKTQQVKDLIVPDISCIEPQTKQCHLPESELPYNLEKNNGNRQTEHTEVEKVCSGQSPCHTHSSNKEQQKTGKDALRQKTTSECFESYSPTRLEHPRSESEKEGGSHTPTTGISKERGSPGQRTLVLEKNSSKPRVRLHPRIVNNPQLPRHKSANKKPRQNNVPECETLRAYFPFSASPVSRSSSSTISQPLDDITNSNKASLTAKPVKKKRRRCGKCSSCTTPDCGECPECLDKQGPKKRKQACRKRETCQRWKEEEYEDAIRVGYVAIEATKVAFSGVPGSGKTTLRSLILDEKLPDNRTSTPVATRATQATIVACDQEKWHPVGRNNIVDMVFDQVDDKTFEKEQITSVPVSSSTASTGGSTLKNGSSTTSGDKKETPIRLKLRALMKQFQQSRKGKKLQLKKMIYLVDVGGQPELQQLVPLFVRNASVNILALKLCDELDDKPKNEWYDEDKAVAPPSEMTLTNKEYLVQTARSLFTRKPKLKIKQATSVPEKPQIVLVGTHKDKEHECNETREDKEKELKKDPIFSTHLIQNSITAIRGQLILDIDGSPAGHDSDENIAKMNKLRNAILTHGSKLEVKFPLSWYMLLENILAESETKDFISLDTCYRLGHEWEMSDENVDAALQFFDELNLILYCHRSLPDVVICNPEFLLKKLNSMIVASVSTPDIDDKVGLRQTYKTQGIFSRQLFETPEFLKGFNELFSLEKFLYLLQDMPIIAKIKFAPENEEYFIPCVLPFEKSLLSGDLQGSQVDPLIIIFPSKCSPTGVFCATIVHLIKGESDDKLKWIITSSESQKRKQNKIEFEIHCQIHKKHFDSRIGTVLLMDTSTHFVIQTTCSPQYCFELSSMFERALEKSLNDLSYDAVRIDYVFGVQCTSCTDEETRHVSSIGPDNKWKCDQKHVRYNLSERQRPWFEETSEAMYADEEDTAYSTLSPDKPPKLHQLMWLKTERNDEINIIENVASDWGKVAMALKFSPSAIKIIEKDNKSDCEKACQEMFRQWLDGKKDTRKPVLWTTLIKVLNQCDKSELAKRLSLMFK